MVARFVQFPEHSSCVRAGRSDRDSRWHCSLASTYERSDAKHVDQVMLKIQSRFGAFGGCGKLAAEFFFALSSTLAHAAPPPSSAVSAPALKGDWHFGSRSPP